MTTGKGRTGNISEFRNRMRGRWSKLGTGAGLLAVLVMSLTGAATATAAAAQASTLASCSTATPVTPNYAGASIPTLGTDTAAWGQTLDSIQGLNLPHAPLIFYGGAVITQAQLGTWVDMTESHCLPGGLNVGAFFKNGGGISRVVKYVNYLNQFDDVQRYLVFTHDIGSHATVNALVAAMHKAICNGAKVVVVDDMKDWQSASVSAGDLKLLNGDFKSIAYFPFSGSPRTWKHFYGPLSATSTAAKADAMVGGGTAVGVIQAFSYFNADPASGVYFRFSHKQITDADVLSMASSERKAGARTLIADFLEPFADCGCAVNTVIAGLAAQVG